MPSTAAPVFSNSLSRFARDSSSRRFLFVKPGTFGPELRVFGARSFELRSKRLRLRCTFAQSRNLNSRCAQFGNRALEFTSLLRRSSLRRPQPRTQVSQRARGEEPADRAANSSTKNQGEKRES